MDQIMSILSIPELLDKRSLADGRPVLLHYRGTARDSEGIKDMVRYVCNVRITSGQ